jgi:4-carboxymuconolactone decarboxylase
MNIEAPVPMSPTQPPSDGAHRPIEITDADLNADQHAIYDAIRNGPRGVVEGPLRVWLLSPGLADRAQSLGAFCRYGTRLPPRLSELAILVTGSMWRAGFEWHVHAPIAIAAGVDAEAVEAIRKCETPSLEGDERAVYRFAQELLATHQVSDPVYRGAIEALGREAVVELVGILGYYGLISMTINAFRVPLPPGAEDPFADTEI